MTCLQACQGAYLQHVSTSLGLDMTLNFFEEDGHDYVRVPQSMDRAEAGHHYWLGLLVESPCQASPARAVQDAARPLCCVRQGNKSESAMRLRGHQSLSGLQLKHLEGEEGVLYYDA